MKLFSRIIVPLLLFAGLVTAESPGAQNGRLDLGNGLAIEYKVIPYDTKEYRDKHGRIGPIFGTDGGVPHTKLAKLTLVEGKRKTPLEASCMYDPWIEQIDVHQFRVRLTAPRRRILTGNFSDAAATYVAEWLIVDGIGVRTLLSNEPSVVREKLLQ